MRPNQEEFVHGLPSCHRKMKHLKTNKITKYGEHFYPSLDYNLNFLGKSKKISKNILQIPQLNFLFPRFFHLIFTSDPVQKNQCPFPSSFF